MVSGVATLGGTFKAVKNGALTNGSTFVVLTATSITGAFSPSYFDISGNGTQYANIIYTKTGATTTGVSIKIAATILPIELLSFTAKADGAKNHLYWVTASEKDNAFFDVERSLDGKNFSSIGQVKGANKPSSYEWIDDAPFGITYYRLRQVDFDGAETYSKIVSVAQKGGKGFQLYPTLVANGVLTVAAASANTGGPEGFDYAVFNLLGQAVQTGKTTSQVDVSALPAGTYILKAGADQAKFVKE